MVVGWQRESVAMERKDNHNETSDFDQIITRTLKTIVYKITNLKLINQ